MPPAAMSSTVHAATSFAKRRCQITRRLRRLEVGCWRLVSVDWLVAANLQFPTSNLRAFPLVRPRCRYLEREGDRLRLLVAERHRLRLPSGLLVPRLDRVGSRRNRLQLERAVAARDGEVGMIDDADVGVHPGMDVALEGDHYLGRGEGHRVLHPRDDLAEVELAIGLRHP